MIEIIFLKLLEMSTAAGFCIMLVLLARLALRRAPKIYSYALWAVVLLRLVIPVFPEGRFGLVPAWMQGALGRQAYEEETVWDSSVHYRPQNNGLQNNGLQNNGLQNNGLQNNGPQNNGPRNSGPYSGPMNLPACIGAAGSGLSGEAGVWAGMEGSFYYPGNGQPLMITERIGIIRSERRWVKICSRVWLAGFLLLLSYGACSTILLSRRLRTARLLSDGVYESGRIDTPFLFGILPPRIYLPEGVGEREKLYILRHETVHLKRMDNLFKSLSFLAVCLHWFHPLVWAAFLLTGRDMEMSCDESVVRGLNLEAKEEYAHALLKLSVNRRAAFAGPLAFGEDNIEARIKNVLSSRKPAILTGLAALALALAVGAGLLFNYRPPESGSGSAEAGGTGAVEAGGAGTSAGTAGTGAVEAGGAGTSAGTAGMGADAGDRETGTDGASAAAGDASEDSPSKEAMDYNMSLRESTRGKALTLDLLIGELAPLKLPVLADYCGYTNAEWVKLEDRDNYSLTDYLVYHLTDEKTAETYELQVYYWIEDNSLDMVLLWRDSDGAPLALYRKNENQHTFYAADVADVEKYLNTKEDMSTYLSYELPENVKKGAYNYNLGVGGGEIFTWVGKEKYREFTGSDWIAPEWKAAGGVLRLWDNEYGGYNNVEFQDGKINGYFCHWNHSSPVGKGEPLEGCGSPAFLQEYEHDLYTASEDAEAEESGHPIPEEDSVSRMWYVFFAKEGSLQTYCVYLNKYYFSREDVIKLARSVKFTDQAFSCY